MKFLLEFVGCFGVSRGGGGPKEVPESVGRLSEEETHALVAVRRNHWRKKRGRGPSTVGNNNSGVEWKPTLSAISENNAAVVVGKTAGERLVKRKGSVGGGGGSRDIASLSDYVENYRRNRVMAVIPAFSPAPFMI
ncbi:PREDICTED: uncharacterized protein LOC105142362 isoform X2 [Populus euphratica]|uniref:Uncharacterized protein LOC105142362 isoform X1 n=1 Tax=Populus euphratica TaxID=75702 RepID=A0AAJ6VHE7_POPEU|nr:PREDICTED: uncharacterized protein LOC105142362 isoform X1 [Populus euphratica]XP_011048257.1 PREDICTED: uncharacterized protein LOC105142362 isoform X2 [Populus euphratica]